MSDPPVTTLRGFPVPCACRIPEGLTCEPAGWGPSSSQSLMPPAPLCPQECAPGFYRDVKGLFLGRCVPCQCHGHSDRCLPGSGICVVSGGWWG